MAPGAGGSSRPRPSPWVGAAELQRTRCVLQASAFYAETEPSSGPATCQARAVRGTRKRFIQTVTNRR